MAKPREVPVIINGDMSPIAVSALVPILFARKLNFSNCKTLVISLKYFSTKALKFMTLICQHILAVLIFFFNLIKLNTIKIELQ